jgi:septum formation protein
MGSYRPFERKTRDMKLVLASASPRRREILTTLGVDFTVRTAEADETCDLSDPGARVEAISVKKCHAVRDALSAEGALDADTVILASDTLVMLDGEFLGKPRDEADARRMVGMLQGRTHTVASGLAIYKDGRTVTAHELTGVSFAPMNETEIETYIATGESFGKAGGYAVQGFAARFISGLEGDYFNVVGLPVRRLYETLREGFGIVL